MHRQSILIVGCVWWVFLCLWLAMDITAYGLAAGLLRDLSGNHADSLTHVDVGEAVNQ